jgi:hypothetical protein
MKTLAASVTGRAAGFNKRTEEKPKKKYAELRQEKQATRVHTHPKMGATVFNYSTTATVKVHPAPSPQHSDTLTLPGEREPNSFGSLSCAECLCKLSVSKDVLSASGKESSAVSLVASRCARMCDVEARCGDDGDAK